MKNSPRDLFFSLILFAAKPWPANFVSFVCGGFNENDIAFSLACIYQARGTELLSLTELLFAFQKKKQYVCGAVNESCKTYSTSAVPLLVQNVQYVCGAVARNL